MLITLTVIYVLLTGLELQEVFPILNGVPIIPVMLTVVSVLALVAVGRVWNQTSTMLLLAGAFLLTPPVSWLLNRWPGGAINSLYKLYPALIMLALAIVAVTSFRHLHWLRWCLILAALAPTIPGFRAYQDEDIESPYIYAIPDQVPDDAEQTYTLRLMALGRLHDPNQYAQLVIVALPLLMYGFRIRKISLLKDVLFRLPLVGVMLTAIALTKSRGAAVALLLLMICPILLRKRKWGIAMLAVIAVLGPPVMSVVTGREISVQSGGDRLAIWSDGLAAFKSSPIWGVGFGNFANFAEGMTAHNAFLLCAAELGIIGAFLWVALLLLPLIQLYRIISWPEASPEVAAWARSLFYALIGFTITAFFLSRAYVWLPFLLFGMSSAFARLVGNSNTAPESESTLQLIPAAIPWPKYAAATVVGCIAVIYLSVRLRV
jgi:putative inorganic carbon (HCO3(-)) transporter